MNQQVQDWVKVLTDESNLGKAIIYFFDSNSDDNELDIEGEINKEIKKMEGVDAKVVSYRKLD